MRTLSVVLPAIGETAALQRVLQDLPTAAFTAAGWQLELIVVTNDWDGAAAVAARSAGARALACTRADVGAAAQAGLETATGDVLVLIPGDATYPVAHLAGLVQSFCDTGTQLLTTNRLIDANLKKMSINRRWANIAYSSIARMIYRHDVSDVNSAMLIIDKNVWQKLTVKSSGTGFFVELKNAAFRAKYRVAEVPIEYWPTLHNPDKLSLGLLTMLITRRIHPPRPAPPITIELPEENPTRGTAKPAKIPAGQFPLP